VYKRQDLGSPDVEDCPVFLGAREQGIAPFFAGRLDDVRFYNRALSAKQLAALVAEGAK
jgi:hypothetical protein